MWLGAIVTQFQSAVISRLYTLKGHPSTSRVTAMKCFNHLSLLMSPNSLSLAFGHLVSLTLPKSVINECVFSSSISFAVIPTQQYCFQQYDHAESWMECPPVTGTTTVKASCRQIVMIRSGSFISNGVVCKHSLHCRLGLDRMR